MMLISVADSGSIAPTLSGRYPGGANPCDTPDHSTADSNGKAADIEHLPEEAMVIDDKRPALEYPIDSLTDRLRGGDLAPAMPD